MAGHWVATGRNNFCWPMLPRRLGCQHKALIRLDWRCPCRFQIRGGALRGEHGYSRKWDGRESVLAAAALACVPRTPALPMLQRRADAGDGVGWRARYLLDQ